MRVDKSVFFVFLLAAILFFGGNAIAASNWARTYGGTGYDDAHSVVQTSDGGFITTGRTESFGAGGADCLILKMDQTGAVEWQKSYGGTSNDWGYCIRQTADGGFIAAGSTYSYGTGVPSYSNFWVLKLDSSGGVQWQKAYGRYDGETAYSVEQTSDNGFIVAGSTASYGAGYDDFWVIKLDPSGVVQWQKTYGGSNYECASAVVQTSDNGFAVAGYTRSYGAGDWDYWVLKLDSAGVVEWQKTFGGTYADRAHSVEQTSDSGFIVSGYTESFASGGGASDFWVLKLDSSGVVQWQKTYGDNGWDTGNSITETSEGGYVAAGSYDTFGSRGYDCWLIKLDASGNVTWQRTYGYAGHDYAYSVSQLNDGGYIVAGEMYNGGTYFDDYWIFKLDPDGYIDTSCTFYNDTSVTGADTSATVTDTAVTGTVSANTPLNSAVSGSDTAALVTEQCSSPAPAGEVSPTGAAQPLVFTDNQTIIWESAVLSGSDTFNLYRGYISGLATGNYGRCIQSGLTDNWTTDDPAFPPVWARTYARDASADVEYVRDIQQTSDGGFILAGQSSAGDWTVYSSLWIIKLDAFGDVEWEAPLEPSWGARNELSYLVRQAADGGYLTLSFCDWGTGGDIWAGKLDGSGTLQWQRNYSAEWDEAPHAVEATADSGFIIAGRMRSSGISGFEGWLLKIDSSGAVQWSKTYAASEKDDEFNSVIQTPDGGYAAAGVYNYYGGGTGDFWFVKVDGTGETEWQKTYSGSQTDMAYSVCSTLDGGYILTGQTYSFSSNNMLVIKTDSSGKITWQKAVSSGVGTDVGYAVRQTADGGYILAGLFAMVAKLDPSGSILWQRAYVQYSSLLYTMDLTDDGGFIAAGRTAMPSDYLVLKMDKDGRIGSSCAQLVDLTGSSTDATATENDTLATAAVHLTGTATPVFGSAFSNLSFTETCSDAMSEANWFYLVTGVNGDGEGTMGLQSDGITERLNSNPCE